MKHKLVLSIGILSASIIAFLAIAGIAEAITDCWLYRGNATACSSYNGCIWRPTATNPWCTDPIGCCEMIGCGSFDGNQSGCSASSNLGLTCNWAANDKNQNPWCPFKKIGDWSPSGQITTEANIGCCNTVGCYSRDGTNESHCEASNFLNGICEWHHKNSSNPLNYDPYCQNSIGCCVVPPCQMFNSNETRCNTAQSLNFPCTWTNSTQTCGSAGCTNYHNQSSDCMDHGCNYNMNSGECAPPSGGGFIGGGTQNCWFADNNPLVCVNITGCVYCTNDADLIGAQLGGGNISNNQSFCYNEQIGYCEGHQSDADTGIEYTLNKTYFNVSLATDNIECSDVRVKQACDCGPFPSCKWSNSSATFGNYCGSLNRTKTADETEACRPTIGNQTVKFCEDPKITSEINCSWLTTNFNMPCKWDANSSKCKFSFQSVFKTGPVGDMWEIDTTNGGETACTAAKGVWATEQYEENGVIQSEGFCQAGTTNGGMMIDNCNSFCGACEWFFSNGTEVESLAQATAACNSSSLGFCQFRQDSNAANTYGFCQPPAAFKFGGGDCKTDCKSCGLVSTNPLQQQAACENSSANCVWENTTMGSACHSAAQGSCSNDCTACPSQQDCSNSAAHCTWDSSFYYCKAQGFTGEICFDTFDNDGDSKTDCADSDCTFNEFCGGTALSNCGIYTTEGTCTAATTPMGVNCSWVIDIWSNVSRCANPGEQCWMYEDNETSCNASSGCGWVNFTAQGEAEDAWCDAKKSIGRSCNGKNITSCQADSNCSWNSMQGGGFCEFFIFAQCGQLNKASCDINSNCTWSTQFMGPMMPGMQEAGHCEPACFNGNINSSQCTAISFCEWKETTCEPSFMSDCADYDGNQSGCVAQPMCQWYANENLCDPRMGGTAFAGIGGGEGFVGGGGGGSYNQDFSNAMEFFHLGNDNQHDFTMPSGWTGTTAENDTLEAVDIAYFGIKDMGEELGFGIGVTQTKMAAMCNGRPTHFYDANGLPSANNTGTNTTKFYWYLDTDGNSANNCNATNQNSAAVTGFEFFISYLEEWSTATNSSVSTRTVYRCSNSSWIPTNIALFIDKVVACQYVGGAGIAVEKEDFEKYPQQYNSTAVMRVFVAGGHNRTFIADSAGPGYYTPGTLDFKPECCLCAGDPDMDGDGKPASTDEECTFIKQKGFMSFEDCFNGKDDNNDGAVDCNDVFCTQMPKCGGTFNFIVDANDKKSPTVIFMKTEEWPDGAFIKFDTDEPATGTILFYGNDSVCAVLNNTVNDLGDPSFTFDDYKPFHGIVLDQNSLGYFLNAGTAYYFKTMVADPSNNTAKSSCLNFTTKSEFKKVLLDVDLDSGYTVDLRLSNGSYLKQNWNGTYAIKINTSQTKNMNLTVKCNSGNYKMTFVGVDITKPGDIDLQDKLICSPDDTMIGMDSDEEAWHETMFELGMGGTSDYIVDEFPVAYSSGNSLTQCDEDTAASCTNITDYASCSGNSSATFCKIPTSVGYSGHSITSPPGDDGDDGDDGSGGSGGGGGGIAKVTTIKDAHYFAELVKDIVYPVTVGKEGIYVTGYELKVNNDMKAVTVTVEALTAKPEAVQATTEDVYQYLDIKAAGLQASNLSLLKFKFKINDTWFEGRNKSTAMMQRYAADSWIALQTTFLNDDGKASYYEAVSPGFSTFAITAAKIPAAVAAPEGQAEAGLPTGAAAQEGAAEGEAAAETKGELHTTWIVVGILAIIAAVLIIIFHSRRQE